MVNWKKLFEEDYDELEEKSNSKTKKRKSLFEEEKVEGFDDEEDYYAALEAELNESKSKEPKISKLKSASKFEEDELEDYYEEDEYQAALEEELREAAERTEKSRSFFKKEDKGVEDDFYKEEEFTDADLDFEEEEEKKSRFSLFKKKDKSEEVYEETEEDVYETEDDLGLEEEKEKKSRFSLFKKKDKSEEVYEEAEEDVYETEDDLGLEEEKEKKSRFSLFKKKDKSEEVYEDVEENYSEDDFYDEDSFVDADDEIEEDIYADLEKELGLDETSEEEEKKSSLSLFNNKDKEEVYEESDESYYDDLGEELDQVEEKKERKGFSFAALKERFTGNDDREESEDDLEFDEEDLLEEEQRSAIKEDESVEYEEFADDLELEKKESKREAFFAKIVSLFKSKKQSDKEEYDEYYFEDESEDDEAEDYKTYLERQKQEARQSKEEVYDEFDLEEDYYEEDLELEKDSPSRPSGKALFASMKERFSKFKSSKKDTDEVDYESSDYEEELELEEAQEEKSSKKEGFLGRFMNKSKEESEEELEIEYIEEESISDKLDLIEEKEVTPEEEENITLQESLRSFGIETDKIESVDVFEERSPREERERRVHPTLASVKVRRILQEKEIDDIAYDLSLEDDKDRFAKSIARTTQEVELEPVVEDVHESKHQEEIERLNHDFNRVSRKQDKISTSENFLKDRNGDKIDDAMNSIKSTQEEISRDTRDYTIEVEESEGAPNRRSKLSYTSLDDILTGNEDVLETDIERKKRDNRVSDEPLSEEIENFRKDLFKDKTSEDLVSNRERSNLDNLILETNIVEKSNEKELEEVTMLEENLALIKEDKYKERVSRRFEDDLSRDFEEEISIEKVARDSEYKFESYDDLKQTEEDYTYSDYDLDEEEVYELETQNVIEYKSDQVDIEALNRELKQKKIDEYRSQYWGTKKKSEASDTTSTSEAISSTSTAAAHDYAMSKKFQSEKPRGIEYEEKLYTNDVDEYFVTEDAPLTFGEYKTQDRGYRPVSKTTIEEKQRKLDAIFDKYSNVKIPRRNTTEYVQQKITSPVRVDKYKPTQVVSAIYGTSRPAPAETRKVAKDVKAVASAVSTPKAQAAKNNYFQEIASKEEQSWNLDLAPRVPKNKKSKKK